MQRRTLLKMFGALPLAAAVSRAFAAESGVSEAFYRNAIVIDGQAGLDAENYGKVHAVLLPNEIADIKRSGMTALSVTIGQVGNVPNSLAATLDAIGQVNALIDANPAVLMHALSAADIRQAKREGKLALVYNFQDTFVIGPELERLDIFRGLGVRIVQLTYNKRNLSGDGSLERANAGISDLGRATIDKIEALDLLLDLSHGGQRTIAEAIAYAKRPMLISHTGCRALHENPRNVGDAELKAMADKGGVMGVYFMPFLTANGKPTRRDVIDHLEHAVKVCGEDHVSIGTDGGLGALVIDDKARENQRKFFEDRKAKGIAAPGEAADVFNLVMDYNDATRFKLLADDLARAGWKDARIEKVLGANLLRIYAEAWRG